MKSSSLMDLELADYQRSIETLRGQVKVGENNRNELEKKITSLEKQVEDVNQELGNNSKIIPCNDLSLSLSLSLFSNSKTRM